MRQLFCNMCGKEEDQITDDFLNIVYQFGYDSGFDGKTIDFDLCSTCIENLIIQFKLPCIKD